MSSVLVCPYGACGVGGKWMFRSMYHLLDGERRFGELRRLMPGAGRQTLVTQLRALERAGVVHRRVSADVPPEVGYSLTPLGRDCEPVLRRLHGWGEWFTAGRGADVDWLVVLGGRWKVPVVRGLFDGPKRFGELRRLLAPVSNRVLARELRELADLGLVRHLPAQAGTPRGAYALTDVGVASVPVFRELHAEGVRAATLLGVAFPWPADLVCGPLHPG